MSKNLGKYKQELKTRECLVQAIYQYIFQESNLNSLIDQFLKENTPKKISFNYFKKRLENIFEYSDDLKSITRSQKIKKVRILKKLMRLLFGLELLRFVPMNLIIQL